MYDCSRRSSGVTRRVADPIRCVGRRRARGRTRDAGVLVARVAGRALGRFYTAPRRSPGAPRPLVALAAPCDGVRRRSETLTRCMWVLARSAAPKGATLAGGRPFATTASPAAPTCGSAKPWSPCACPFLPHRLCASGPCLSAGSSRSCLSRVSRFCASRSQSTTTVSNRCVTSPEKRAHTRTDHARSSAFALRTSRLSKMQLCHLIRHDVYQKMARMKQTNKTQMSQNAAQTSE
jgi:hypothetical protein